MQDSSPKLSSSSAQKTGSWKPAEAAAPNSGADPPTVRTGQAEAGSSFHRRQSALPMPQPGDRLESFELERAIGVGGMGAVYLATDTRLHREVALKVLPPEQSNDSEVVQRFYQEGRAAARLDHENIARVFTIGSDKGYYFIAFEYIEGTTLRQRVQDLGPLPISEAINFTLQIAGALVHAAKRGVVHRDIKPSNIIITPQGRAKLVDMGLARRFERDNDDGGLTQSNMTLGTFDYISPEQALDPRDVDVRGDLYSLGCTLFHVLTGRPPFPEGTVLQKLLQHRDEPPPDVRLINPSVPEDLAAILVKLMAKDRERRYQTPELLVRDLLTVAGAIGLRSMSPEGLVWMSAKGPPSWEKHLVWGIPAGALLLVVAMLAWFGQPPENASAVEHPLPVAANPSTIPTKPRPATTTTATTKEPTAPAVAASPRPRPRNVTLKAGDDLAAALAKEASGSTFVLSDEGPYLLVPASSVSKLRRDVTIKAAPGVRPVLQAAQGPKNATADAAPALLGFGIGHVTIENVDFLLDAGDTDTSWTAIRAEGTNLTLRRCSFRRGPGRSSGAKLAAVRLRPAPGASDPPESPVSFLADACHFDGGMIGLWVKGSADLRIRDGTFGPQEPSFWFDNGGSSGVVPVDMSLHRVSIQAGRGPVLLSSGTVARLNVDHSALATTGERTATLVSIDDADRLDWRGKANVYAGIDTYLSGTRAGAGQELIRDFESWSDDPLAYREVGSVATLSPVWEAVDPSTSSPRTNNPSSGFVLAEGGRLLANVGAHHGPRGPIGLARGALAGLMGFTNPGRATKKEKAPAEMTGAAPTPAQVALGPATPKPEVMPPPAESDPRPDDVASEVANVEIKPMDRSNQPMPNAPMERDPVEDVKPATVVGPPIKEVVRPAPDLGAKEPLPPAEETIVRSAEGFRAELERQKPRGGTLRIAADADILLPSSELPGAGRWVLQAEPGVSRPRLRFRPSPDDPRRPALFILRAGSLELRGIDVILEEKETPDRGDWGAFAVRAGTDLSLSNCTVTVEGRREKSAVVFVVSGDGDGENGVIGEMASAQVRANDSLLRGGGDLVDVAAGHRLDLELTDVVVGAGGSLVHGHGLPRAQTPEPLKVVLRQVSARVEGGLALLESAPGEPELPQADFLARDMIVTTNGRLFRVEGQDELDGLGDRVKWEGHNVSYGKVEVYRRDQSARTGTLPLRFDRPSWDRAVAPHDETPTHGDIPWLHAWESGRSPATLTREDVLLDPEGPIPTAGPDMKRIPNTPFPSSRVKASPR